MGKPASSDPSEWVDRYGDYLFRFGMLRLRDRSAAEDMVQETFLAALNSRGSFSGGSSEATWLTGIREMARHLASMGEHPGEPYGETLSAGARERIMKSLQPPGDASTR